jgi:hypothetical protein
VEIGQKMWKLVRTDGQTDRQIPIYPPKLCLRGGIITEVHETLYIARSQYEDVHSSRISWSIEFYPCYASLDLGILRQFSIHFVIANYPT